MPDHDLPLQGIRVLDLGIITAGAGTSALLADLGADVIKVEAPNYIDPFRVWVDFEKKDDWWNFSPYYNFTNRNKRSLCLDLKTVAGRNIFLRLVVASDILVENFRRGVMDRLGLSADTLQMTNPKLIIAAISSQGATGPERDVSSFGSTLEATSGMAYLAGPVDGSPILSGRDVNYPDQVVALFAAAMITAALLSRRKTDSGIYLDISQRELTSFLLGEKFLCGDSMSLREGNADSCTSLQLVVRTVDGSWIAVTAASSNPNYSENSLREMLATMPMGVAVAWLQSKGFAHSIVLDGNAIRQAPWFARSNAFFAISEGQLTKGFPFQFRGAPMSVTRPTPKLGQNTASVLREILDLTDRDLEALASTGVIGEKPHS